MTEHKDDGSAADLGALIGRTVQAVEHAPGETYAVVTLNGARLYADDPTLYLDELPVPDGCTGYRDPQNPAHGIQHDGDTCPVHEAGPIPPVRSSATIAGDDTAGDPEHNRTVYVFTRSDVPDDEQNARYIGQACTIVEEHPGGWEWGPLVRFESGDTLLVKREELTRARGIGYVLTDAYRLAPIKVTLDAMEPRELLDPAAAAGIAVTVHRSGLAVTLDGPRAAVRDLIAERWGDDDLARETTGMPKDHGPHTIRAALLEAADATTTLADIDEGEHTDTDRLRRVADIVSTYARANLASLDEQCAPR